MQPSQVVYYATVSGGDGIYQKSGKTLSRLLMAEGDKVKTACRLVDDTMANKWYHVKSVSDDLHREKSAELGGKGKQNELYYHNNSAIG
jgi:hypothetical protein